MLGETLALIVELMKFLVVEDEVTGTGWDYPRPRRWRGVSVKWFAGLHRGLPLQDCPTMPG